MDTYWEPCEAHLSQFSLGDYRTRYRDPAQAGFDILVPLVERKMRIDPQYDEYL